VFVPDAGLDQVMACDWVVYAKPCLDATPAVVQHLARYSHKIALTDHRLVGMDEQAVSFRYTDYRDDRHKVMTLASEEFLRRGQNTINGNIRNNCILARVSAYN
jgi:hypothetical protein